MRRLILTLAAAALALVAFAATAQARPGQHRAPTHDRAFATSVQVEWGGTWWDAEILDSRGGQHLISYVGWSSTWDEWVGTERVRPRAGARSARSTRGPVVQILWGSSWYSGVVLDQRGGRYLVSYDGYGSSWDEWVGPDRVRFAEPPPSRRRAPQIPPRHVIRR